MRSVPSAAGPDARRPALDPGARCAPVPTAPPQRRAATRRGATVLVATLVAALLLLTTSDPSALVPAGQSLLAPLAMLAGVASLFVYVGMSRRRAARAGRTDESAQPLMASGVGAHRRVRVAIYGVLLVVGAQAALHAWFAESAERARAEDARLAELAARQRMIGQLVARLASTLPAQGAGLEEGLRALDDALGRAGRDPRVGGGRGADRVRAGKPHRPAHVNS